MTVMIVIMMMVRVAMLMIVSMFLVGVAVQMRLAARQPRVLAEHQRFDRHRHGHRRQPDTAEIDIIEVPQHDAPSVCATSPSSMM